MKRIRLTREISEAEADKLAGTFLDHRHYDVLVSGETTAVTTPSGAPLLTLVTSAIDKETTNRAYNHLRDVTLTSDNRGMAGGELHDHVGGDQDGNPIGARSRTRYRALKEDGTISNTNNATKVRSGIAGFFDRNPRYPYCRQTAVNANWPKKAAAVAGIASAADVVFEAHAKPRRDAQMEIVRRTDPAWVIENTAFTTITINKNWRTAAHKDAGDYEPGLGVMTALWAGTGGGAYLVFPRYRCAVEFRTGDVLLADVHQWHGNTPFLGTPGLYDRISFVFYFREKMKNCKGPREELEWAKRRLAGETLGADKEGALSARQD